MPGLAGYDAEMLVLVEEGVLARDDGADANRVAGWLVDCTVTHTRWLRYAIQCGDYCAQTLREHRAASTRCDADDRLSALERARRDVDDRLCALERARRDIDDRLCTLERVAYDADDRLGALERVHGDANDRLGALERARRGANDRLGALEHTRRGANGRLRALETALPAPALCRACGA